MNEALAIFFAWIGLFALFVLFDSWLQMWASARKVRRRMERFERRKPTARKPIDWRKR